MLSEVLRCVLSHVPDEDREALEWEISMELFKIVARYTNLPLTKDRIKNLEYESTSCLKGILNFHGFDVSIEVRAFVNRKDNSIQLVYVV